MYDEKFIVKQQKIKSYDSKEVKIKKFLDSIYEFQILCFEKKDYVIEHFHNQVIVIENN